MKTPRQISIVVLSMLLSSAAVADPLPLDLLKECLTVQTNRAVGVMGVWDKAKFTYQKQSARSDADKLNGISEIGQMSLELPTKAHVGNFVMAEISFDVVIKSGNTTITPGQGADGWLVDLNRWSCDTEGYNQRKSEPSAQMVPVLVAMMPIGVLS